MKTQQEIIDYYKEIKEDDFFGFKGDILLSYLDKEHVMQFLKPGAILSDEWKANPLERDFIIKEMKEYMEFAWDKAERHRGLSATRSIEKMQAYLWLLEDDDTLTFSEREGNYKNYGAPILWKICEVYGFPIPESSAIKNMSEGKPCKENCQEGCDRLLIY